MRPFRPSPVALLLGFGLSPGSLQGQVQTSHRAMACWPVDQFLVVRSTFEPATDLQTAKVYFRTGSQPDYYFVEMSLSGAGSGRAVAPKAQPGSGQVVYYIELVTTSFNVFRTEALAVPVTSGAECRRMDPGTPFYSGPEPAISIGSTRLGAPRMPPGFQAEGITRFISTNSAAGGSGGGGFGGKTLGIAAGAGGAGAAALLLGSPSSGGAPGSGNGMTSPTTSPSTSTAVGATSTTTISPGTTTTTVGASSTTTSVPGGSTTTSVPSSTTTTSIGGTTTTMVTTSSTTTSVTTSTTTTSASTTSIPGTTSSTSTSTTTSIASSTTTAFSTTTTSIQPTTSVSTTTTAGGSTADVSVTKSGPPSVNVGQDFVYTLTVDNGGPATATGILVFDTWTAGLAIFRSVNNPACAPVAANRMGCNIGSLTSAQAPVSIRVTLRATSAGTLRNEVNIDFPSPPSDPNAGNDSASFTTRIANPLSSGPLAALELVYRSRMDVEPGGGVARGQIVLNGSDFQETDSSGEFLFSARGREGPNRIEAQAALPGVASGSWRFDFSGSRDFVPGSVRVEAGRVLAQDGSSITFGLGNGAGAPRFTFELGEARRRPGLTPEDP